MRRAVRRTIVVLGMLLALSLPPAGVAGAGNAEWTTHEDTNWGHYPW